LPFVGLFSCTDQTTDDKIRVGFSQALSGHPFREEMNHAMRLQASLNDKVELTIKEAYGDIEKQKADMQQMIQNQFDAIIVSPIDPNMVVREVEQAYNIGIPVIVLDRKVATENYTSFVGADNLEVGKNAGNYIASSSNKEINVIEIKGGDNSSPVRERSQGFHNIVDSRKNIRVLASIEGTQEGTPRARLGKVLDSLGNEHIDFIYAFNDEMALQAWEVAREKELEDKIKFIGVDGLNFENGGIEMVRNGILDASILYPTGGAEAIKLALAAIEKKPVAKRNILETTVIDRFNADIMKNQFDRINDQQADLESQIAALKYQEERYYAQNNLLKVTITLLAIILSLAIYSVYSIFTIRKKNRQLELTTKKVTFQRNQIEKIAEEVKLSNEAKLNFFTGISHEFKTPLTLILSSIESISDYAKEKGSRMVNEIELIHNNSNRLLRLINQLLDFRKIEDRNFNLKASKTNLYNFSKLIFQDFEREAMKRNIDFKLTSNNESLDIFIDRNLIDKVYFNLLSNAFKFTPDNGKIGVHIKDDESTNIVKIHFKDTGIGIPSNEIDGVFQAFFKGSNNRKNSSGVGLHLSKEFVEMHKGNIEVESLHGTEFVVSLYKGQAHLDESEIISEQDLVDSNIIDFSSDQLIDDNYLIQAPSKNKEKYSILIIEDNKDLSLFLKNKLQLEYDIHLSDGTDAIEKAFEAIPDIILCDINLPHKDGFEICEILKKDLRTSHIPTVILTALGNKESYIKGLQSGADLYLTKPFSYSILIQSIKSLLYNREKLRYYFTSNIHKIEEINSFGDIEQKFISQLNTLINDNLGNSDYSVENLAENLTISRVQLYRKVKAIMGMSISDYIGNIRLEKAKTMLENSSLTVSEIAYANGFSSPNYFSTAFKNKYGISPGTFRKSV
jgi:signal transduction histidine kinase/AraC-like DNA-binding protein